MLIYPLDESSTPSDSSQSVFGQLNNSSNSPFAPKPTPFGLETGNSMSGGTSTGVFGAAQTSAPFSSNTTFGASYSPALGGSSMPAYGAPSSSSFSVPAFGGFGSIPTQTSPFGSATQPSQPAFGSIISGSSASFGVSSQPTFGLTGTPAFGAISTPAFGSTPTFDSTGSAFGMSSAPVFRGEGPFWDSSNPVFGSSSTSAFEASSSPAFGASSTPAFSYESSTQGFGQSSSAFAPKTSTVFSGFGTSAPSFSSLAFGSSLSAAAPSVFGPSTSYPFCTCCRFHNTPCGQTCRFGNTLCGQTAALSQLSLFCSPSCGPFGGSQTPAPAFGNTDIMQSGFAGQQGGSGEVSYLTTSTNPFNSTIPNSNPFAPKTTTFFSRMGTSAPSFTSPAFGSSLSATDLLFLAHHHRLTLRFLEILVLGSRDLEDNEVEVE